MKINAVICPICKDTIYSRARHDFRTCKCNGIFVDGGFDYLRIGGNKTPEIIEIEINVTKKELYNDWNYHIDKYGRIEEKESKE